MADFSPNISSTTTVAPPSGLWVLRAGRLTNARPFSFVDRSRAGALRSGRIIERVLTQLVLL